MIAVAVSTAAPSTAATTELPILVSIGPASSALQRRIDDREPLVAPLEVDRGDAEHAAQLVVGDLERPRRLRRSWRRLRKCGRARGVEGDVAFNLLHHLVDVAVEHGHRAEALEIFERAGAIVGAPAPLRVDGPQRDVGEQDDWGRGGAVLDVGFEPFELLAAEIAEPAGSQIHHVDKSDKVRAAGVEAVPAGALGAAPV